MPDIPLNTGTTRPSNQTASNKRLVGISFPFRKENGEFPAKERDADCVRNDLLTLFKTPLRSRVMRPLFGHRANDVVFEAQGGLLNAILDRLVKQTIINNEPRVTVTDLNVEEGDRNVDVTIDYVIQGVKESEVQVLSVNR